MAVLMMPGLSGTAAMPAGNSCASDCVSPSIAHFVAQYGATSASVERPQPELKFTMTPLPCLIIAGTKWRIAFATPLMFTSITSENSCDGTFQSGALRLMSAALLRNKSGAACEDKILFAQDWTCESSATSTTEKSFDAGNCFCNCAISFFDRPQPRMVWPSRMNSSVSARPSPRETPVIRIIFAAINKSNAPSPCPLPSDGRGCPQGRVRVQSRGLNSDSRLRCSHNFFSASEIFVGTTIFVTTIKSPDGGRPRPRTRSF
jgi:hypothetical protein